MKTTMFGVLLEVTPEQDTIPRRLMRKYGFMLRFAFTCLLQGLSNIGPWSAIYPGTRSCRCGTRKMPCRKRKTSFGPAINPCKTV